MNVSPNSPHVSDVIVDYIEGRLPVARRDEVKLHLSNCDDCAADFEFATEMRNSAADQGLRHIHPDRLVMLAETGSESFSTEESAHLDQCTTCRQEYSFLEDLPVVSDAPDPAPVSLTERVMRPVSELLSKLGLGSAGIGTPSIGGAGVLRWQWAVPVAGMALLVLMALPRGGSESLMHLVEAEPLVLNSGTRGDEIDPRSFEGLKVQGRGAYNDGDYERAEGFYERAYELNATDVEVALLLGSSRLLTGDGKGATGPLTIAARSDNPDIQEEALWQLANAHLSTGDGKAAREVLQQVIDLDGVHGADAEQKLEALK